MSFLRKLSFLYKYIVLMGFDWFVFRLKYEFLKRIYYFDRVNISIVKEINKIDSAQWYYKKNYLVNKNFKADHSFIKKANKAIDGKIYSFSHEYLDYSVNGKIDWHQNPQTKIKSNNHLSWNNLPDFGEYGDIKLIWEASRFPHVYYYINAYSVTQDEKYANACVSQIMDWIENNPYPLGVNYKCGQEISFRIFTWIQALEYFSDFISTENEEVIVKNIYTSLLRIEANIEYAVRSVKNNHSISEAASLFVGGLLFPQFKASERFVEEGLSYLISETAYQVYNDGSYIQHSFIYERLALDILSFIILIAEKKSYPLPKEIEEGHEKMIVFLYSFVQENGWLPNYGSNDGTNLFPVSSDNYRDFRNSLNFAMSIKKKVYLFQDHHELVEFFNLAVDKKVVLDKKSKFEDGGYYILKNSQLFTFIRCHSYKDRPAQNDMFHLDIWYKGKNIFCDTGSYSYNTNKEFKNNFIGNIGHNTVLVNGRNFMDTVLNFGWSNWTKAKLIKYTQNTFEGVHNGYQKKYGAVCHRTVILENNKIIVIDKITAEVNNMKVIQLWQTKENVILLDEYTIQIDNCILKSSFPVSLEDTYISDYYNGYSKGTRVMIKAESNEEIEIKSEMEFIE